MQVVEKRSKLIVIFILLFSVMVLLLLGNQNIEAAEAKIGLVNLTEVVSSHPYTEKISQTNLNLRNELQKRQEDLNKQGKGLDETGLKKLEDKFNKEWTPIKEKIIAELIKKAKMGQLVDPSIIAPDPVPAIDTINIPNIENDI